MGTGRQRVFKIPNIIYHAPKFSLILIDELDITLHSDALNRMIDKLLEIAENRKLQIVFTSHREQLCNRRDINIRHLLRTSGKTLCFESTTPACLSQLTGKCPKVLSISVEDNVSKAIVEQILRQKKARSITDVNIFGSIENSFTLASAYVLMNKTENRLILVDGDKYISEENKLDQIKKTLTGTEDSVKGKRDKALSLIRQYNIPKGYTPDKYLWYCLCNSHIDSEIVQAAKNIVARDEGHKYLKDIQDLTQANVEEIVAEASQSEVWKDFVQPLSEWINERKIALEI